MTDRLGVELKVGDEVLFAKGAQQDTGLYLGEIIDIIETNHNNEMYRYAAQIKNLENGRMMLNDKYYYELISTYPFKITNPELFI